MVLVLLARGAAADPAPPPSGTLAAGTRWETPIHFQRGPRPGPTVLVVAGIHGDERAPPRAADQIKTWVPKRGHLVVIPRANRPGLAAGKRHTPRARWIDLNRNFPTLDRASPRGAFAPTLWETVKFLRPDWVLDLHEGFDFNRINPKSMGSSVVVVPDERVYGRTKPAAEAILAGVNATVSSPRRHFTMIQPGPKGSLARSLTEVLGIPAFVFETTKVQPMKVRVAQHVVMARTFLQHVRML